MMRYNRSSAAAWLLGDSMKVLARALALTWISAVIPVASGCAGCPPPRIAGGDAGVMAPGPGAGSPGPGAARAELGDIQRAGSDEIRYGAHIDPWDGDGWVHFAVFAPSAEAVRLLLFAGAGDTVPRHVVPMARHGDDWRVKIRGPGVEAGLLYMFQARGGNEISTDDVHGPTFNEHYYINDPYAYAAQDVAFSTMFSSVPYADIAAPVYAGGGKSVVHDHGGDIFPGHTEIAPEDLVIYELHVQDYTARIQGLAPDLRGTYLGLAQSGLTTPGGLTAGIDHLVELGVNAVELMPIMEYDQDTGNLEGRYNHWGYMTSNFFAPEARYASVAGNQVMELKALIQAFHERNIAVFLDVAYTHTAEQAPWHDTVGLARKCYNFMCLAPAQVYRSTDDGRFFSNRTGTGNDVSFTGGDARYTKRLVRDSLAMWHQVYGVDGFRFDLARLLADGSESAADWVDNDERFRAAHLHAEPWDPSGQWWAFMDSDGWGHGNNRWAKWLGRYRDGVRRFSRSGLRDPALFKRLIEGRGAGNGGPASSRPWRSVNFVAVHDGYTLRDCTSFDDGAHDCWDSDGDEDLRRTRSKLLLGVLLTSQGVPLLLQGDEMGRTKSGARTQAEAHDTYNYESTTGDPAIDHVSWIDWRLKDGDPGGAPAAPAYGRELFHWTRDLIALRKIWSHFRRRDFARYVTGAPDDRRGDVNDGGFTYVWESAVAGTSQLAVIWWGRDGDPDVMVLYNEHWAPVTVSNLRAWSRGDWKIAARSWLGDDADFCNVASWQSACPDAGHAIEVAGRSMAILISDDD